MGYRRGTLFHLGGSVKETLYHLIFFLLCAEGLSALIQSMVDRGQMEGVKISRGGLKLSHFFFADDS